VSDVTHIGIGVSSVCVPVEESLYYFFVLVKPRVAAWRLLIKRVLTLF
jgi:hypothetical protein